jgi:hypothetical protein
VGEKYYFVYSSQFNHELCYAVSEYPDRDFKFMGTIVSNGDVGVNGISQQTKMNMTGTTHGSIIEINGQWYVFYHRLTHKSDYSRQACAELITIAPDGTIKQVEMTSCGLNGGPLSAEGIYPAVIACNITNGNMPHGSNKIFKDSFPNVTNNGDERFISEIAEGTLIGYKYFEGTVSSVGALVRGDADGVLEVRTELSGVLLAEIAVKPSDDWTEVSAEVSVSGTFPLYLKYRGKGLLDMKELILRA